VATAGLTVVLALLLGLGAGAYFQAALRRELPEMPLWLRVTTTVVLLSATALVLTVAVMRDPSGFLKAMMIEHE